MATWSRFANALIALSALSPFTEAEVAAFAEEALILANDPSYNDRFGESVALDGDIAVFGAPLDDTARPNGGAAYVFVRGAGGWIQEAELLAPSAGAGARLGTSVAIQNGTILVGAPMEDVGGTDTGSVYVFVRNGTTWVLQQKLTVPDSPTNAQLGRSVDIDSDRTIAGMPGDNSAFVFARSGSSWSLEARLSPGATVGSEQFGFSVDLDGDRAMVGARTDFGPVAATGAAYVFLRSGTTWAKEARLIASDGQSLALFGTSVALDGDTALIGAPGLDVQRGAAYVFQRREGTWTEKQKLFSPAGFVFDQLGTDVALQGDVAAVGDFLGPDGAGHGAVRLFVRSELDWREGLQLIASNAVVQTFGKVPELSYSIALDGSTLLAGAPFDDSSGTEAGTVFAFAAPLLSFCDESDGALASCPCDNVGDRDSGCDIVQRTGGVRLAWIDQRTSPRNRATLSATGLPTAEQPFSILARSSELRAAGPAVFGDGVLCLATPIVRVAATAATGGTALHAFQHGSLAGSGLFHYQAWFRNTPISFCDPTAGFNVSSGRTLLW